VLCSFIESHVLTGIVVFLDMLDIVVHVFVCVCEFIS